VRLAVVTVPLLMTACEGGGRPSPAPRPGTKSAVTAIPSSTTKPAATTPGPPPKQGAAQDFRCAALPGVSFQFPLFAQWEPKRTVERSDGCIVYLNWPIQISFETARLFQVSRIDDYDAKTVLAHAPGTKFSLGTIECFDTRRNAQGVLLSLAFDASRWTADYQRAPGQWDFLQFYGKTTAIRLRLDGGGEEYGFSRRAFRDRVEQTFRFHE